MADPFQDYLNSPADGSGTSAPPPSSGNPPSSFQDWLNSPVDNGGGQNAPIANYNLKDAAGMGQAGASVGSGPDTSPFSQASTQVQSPFQQTPEQAAQTNVSTVDSPVAKYGLLGALGGELGGVWNNTLKNANASTSPSGATVFGDAANLPGIGPVLHGAQALGDVLGGIGGTLQTTQKIIGEPAAGLAGLGLKAALTNLPGGQAPNLTSELGTTPEAITAAVQKSNQGDFGDLAKIGQAEYNLNAQRNPLSEGLSLPFDPTFWLMGGFGEVFKPIESVQKTYDALQATTAVGERAQIFAADATPLQKIWQGLREPFQTLTKTAVHYLGNPGSATDALDLSKTGLRAAPESTLSKFAFPFADTDQARVVGVVKNATDTAQQLAVDGFSNFGEAENFWRTAQDAAQQGNVTPELQSTLAAQGITDSKQVRSMMSLLRDVPTNLIDSHAEQYATAKDMLSQLESARTANNPAREVNQIWQGAQKEIKDMPKTVRALLENAFGKTTDGALSTRPLSVAEAQAALERASSVSMTADLTDHFMPTAVKYSGIQAPGLIKKLNSGLRQWESYFLVGLNPGITAKKGLWDIVNLPIHGANPFQSAAEVAKLFDQIGFRPAKDTGLLFSKAVKGALQYDSLGTGVPKGIQKFSFLTPLNNINDAMGERAYLSSFMKALGSTWQEGKGFRAPNAAEKAALDAISPTAANLMRGQIEGAMNRADLDAIQRGIVPSVDAYKAQLADSLTKAFQEATQNTSLKVDPADLNTFLGSNKAGIQALLKNVAARVAKGEDYNTAFDSEAETLLRRYDQHLSDVRASAPSPDVVTPTQPAPAVPAAPDLKSLSEQDLNAEVGKLMQERDSLDAGRMNKAKAARQQEITSRLNDLMDELSGRSGGSTEPPPAEPAAPTEPTQPPSSSPSEPQTFEEIKQRIKDMGIETWIPEIAKEEEVPNVLRSGVNEVTADQWRTMAPTDRENLLTRALFQQEHAGEGFGLGSDTYQAAGDVPTAMPDVTNLPKEPVSSVSSPDLSDVFKKAIERGIATTNEKGAPINGHLLNVLNKHSEGAPFASMEDVKARADEAIKILDGYTPEVKAATKPLWQMNRKEIFAANPFPEGSTYAQGNRYQSQKLDEWKAAIEQAFSEGKTVPKDVLDGYEKQFGSFQPTELGKAAAPEVAKATEQVAPQSYADELKARANEQYAGWQGKPPKAAEPIAPKPSAPQTDLEKKVAEEYAKGKFGKSGGFTPTQENYLIDKLKAMAEEWNKVKTADEKGVAADVSKTGRQSIKVPGDGTVNVAADQAEALIKSLGKRVSFGEGTLKTPERSIAEEADRAMQFYGTPDKAAEHLRYQQQQYEKAPFISGNLPDKFKLTEEQNAKRVDLNRLDQVIQELDDRASGTVSREVTGRNGLGNRSSGIQRVPYDTAAEMKRLGLPYEAPTAAPAIPRTEPAANAPVAPTFEPRRFNVSMAKELDAESGQYNYKVSVPEDILTKLFPTHVLPRDANGTPILASGYQKTEQKALAALLRQVDKRVSERMGSVGSAKEFETKSAELNQYAQDIKEALTQAFNKGSPGTPVSSAALAEHPPYGDAEQLKQGYENWLKSVADQIKADPSAALNPELKSQSERAMVQTLLDTLKPLAAKDMQGSKFTPEARAALNSYFNEIRSNLLDTKLAAHTAGRWTQAHTILNSDGRWNVDENMSYLFPFSFWALHTGMNIAQDFVDHPALYLMYAKMQNIMDQMQDDPSYPTRLKGMVKIPVPFGLPDWMQGGIYVNPLQTFYPAGEVFRLNQLNKASIQNAIPDPNVSAANTAAQAQQQQDNSSNVLTNLFSLHTPLQLLGALMNGKPGDVQNIVNALPPARLLRGLTAPFVPGGVSAGNSGFDLYYIQRALAEMQSEGTITPDDMKTALLQQKGATWDAAKSRAGLENYTVPVVSGALGFAGKAFSQGEQQYYDTRLQRDALQQSELVRLGGNPAWSYDQQQKFLTEHGGYDKGSPLSQIYTDHPELDAFASMHKAENDPNDFYKQYEVGKLWTQYNAMPILQKNIVKAQLGDDFKNFFVAKDTRDYTQIPTSEILGWANAFKQALPDTSQNPAITPQTPDPEKITFTTDAQNAAYQKFYDNVAQSIGWDKVGALEKEYFALTDKAQQAAFRNTPDGKTLQAYWDTRTQMWKDNPDIVKLLEQVGLKSPDTTTTASAPADPRGAALSQAVSAAGLDWNEIKKEQAEEKALPLGTGQRTAYLAAHPVLARYFQITGAIYGNTAPTYSSNSGYQKQPDTYRYSLKPFNRPGYQKILGYFHTGSYWAAGKADFSQNKQTPQLNTPKRITAGIGG